ncbi:hypothetical protein B795N_01660 [Marinilactibacillus psychrotolerans]|uniref:O-antigen ligase family protein n=1 Tax=Marinilactibacillus psychrotolerans TaxID=191770 RepID=UPI001C7D7B8A|nr:O-antigen ligase family protein [Marinilactibacillus psychrotolerans]GEQ32284.1 hypothetical protein B795N_01660 [Marinilactibacillus psychrotolerans]
MNFKKVLSDYVFNPNYYRYINLIIFIIYFIPSGLNIENIPMKISFVWGLLLLAYDLLTERKMFKQPYWIVLFLLSVSYLLSVVTNYPHQFPDTIINWGYLLISVFIFYVFDPKKKSRNINKHIKILNDILIYMTMVLGTVAIVMFIFNISYRVPAGLGTFTLRQGFIGSRLFGLYTSPNIGSMFGYVSVILMLVNNHLKRGDWKSFQNLYIFNGVIQYLFFILSKSRGTQITIFGFGIMLIIIATVLRISKDKKLWSSVKTWGLGTGVALLVFFSVNNTVEEGLSYIPSIVDVVQYEVADQFGGRNENDENSDLESDKEDREIPSFSRIELRPEEEGSELSSGRVTIWMAGLQLLKQRPLFGVADTDIYRGIETTTQIDESELSDIDIAELKRASGNMHNTYVAVLAKSGIIGFLLLTTFVVLILKDNIIYLLSDNFNIKSPDSQIYVIILVFLLSLFVNDAVENHLIMNNRDVISLIFWTYLGYLNFIRGSLKEKKVE